MTGIVLALAGLTCGDGVPGTGAATAAVAVSVHGAWEGRWDKADARGHADLRDGLLRIVFDVAGERVAIYRVRLQGPGTLVVKHLEGMGTLPGIYKKTDCRLLICIGEPRPTSVNGGSPSLLIAHHPAAPRKP